MERFPGYIVKPKKKKKKEESTKRVSTSCYPSYKKKRGCKKCLLISAKEIQERLISN